jgi:hypothetical protein
VIKTLALITLLFSSICFSAIIQYTFNTQSRVGYHLAGVKDLSSHRHELETNNIIRFPNPWSLGFGLRAFVEAAYASNGSRYADPVRTRDSQDFLLRDLYLQYKAGALTMKLGNQQVVWGEAFGFYYADLVNPKDFRDFGIGPLEKNRLHTPMANFKWNFNENIVQFIYIPKPYFNKSPSIGSDFAFPFTSFFPGTGVTFNDERSLPWGSNNSEYGLRLSPGFSSVDLSILYMNYYDRAPIYVSSNVSGQIQVVGKHPKMETFGITFSTPADKFVIRSEVLYHRNKSFNYFKGNLDYFKANQFVGVIGLDYIVGDQWRMGLQASESYRSQSFAGELEKNSTQLITAHGSFTTLPGQNLDILFAYAPHDGGSLTELSYNFALNKRVELILAADLFNGSSSSQFGLYHPASRGYIQLKTLLGSEAKL